MAAYNPFKDFNPAFTQYQYLETPKVTFESPFGNIDFSEGFTQRNGTYIAPPNTPETQEYVTNNYDDLFKEMGNRHSELTITDEDDSYKTIGKNVQGSKKRALEFFQSKGLNAFQAAGIVGNLIHESGLNTTIKGDGGKAFGIAQWHPDRQKGLKELAKSRGTDISDFDTQLEYVWKELNSSEKSALDKLLKSKNTKEATMAFMSFERPGNPQFQKRLNYANELLNG